MSNSIQPNESGLFDKALRLEELPAMGDQPAPTPFYQRQAIARCQPLRHRYARCHMRRPKSPQSYNPLLGDSSRLP